MEDLCLVKDGSKNRDVFHKGYHMTGLLAIGGRRRNPMVLCYDIWSTESEGYTSQNCQTERIMREAFLRAGEGSGEISLDRGYDDAKIFSFIEEYGFSYCVRAKSQRKYEMDGKRMDVEEMGKTHKGKSIQRFTDSEGNEKSAKCLGFAVTHKDIEGQIMLAMEKLSESDVRFYITNSVDVSKEGVMHAIRLYRKDGGWRSFSGIRKAGLR